MLSLRQNGRHFPDDTFKWMFWNENIWISLKISSTFVRKGPSNNIPALVQIMAWHRAGDKALSKTMMVSVLTHICQLIRHLTHRGRVRVTHICVSKHADLLSIGLQWTNIEILVEIPTFPSMKMLSELLCRTFRLNMSIYVPVSFPRLWWFLYDLPAIVALDVADL